MLVAFMVRGKYFEEFDEGDAFVSHWKKIRETHFVNFVTNNGFVEPMFDDPEFGEDAAGHQKQMIPGFLTMATAYGFFTQSNWLTETGLALMDCSISFEEPVFVDDDIRCKFEVEGTTATSSDRGGVVELAWDIESRDDDIELVAEMESTHFVRKQG